jgi:MFS family permease
MISFRALRMPALPHALRHRDYTLLWSGQTISVVGDGIYTVAIALEALRISDHPATLAYVEGARVAPNAVFLLFAGALVDRLPRRLVVLGANALRAVAIAVLAALVAVHALNLTELVLVSAAVGTGDAFFYPAYPAIMPELLPADLLTQGNAFNSASQTAGGALMQVAVPPQMLGRASSVNWLFSICLSPLGIVLAGALAGSIGVRATVLAGAGVAALSCSVVFVPGVRDPERAGYAPVPLPGELSDLAHRS